MNELSKLFGKLPAIGFEDFLSSGAEKFPYFNLHYNKEADSYLIEVAVAGFAKSDLNVTCSKGILVINGKRHDPSESFAGFATLWSSIALRSFSRSFVLGNRHEVGKVTLDKGILSVTIVPVDQPASTSIPIDG